MPKQSGFTLAELLVVMAIASILTAVAVPTFGRQLEMARENHDLLLFQICYTDAMTCAYRDFADGTLDGAYRGVTIDMNDFTGNSTGGTVTYTTTTLPEPFQQNGTWDYVAAYIDGVTLPPVDGNVTGLTFTVTASGSRVTCTNISASST